MTESTLEGLNFCLTILIPALFPFMVLSGFLVLSGISNVIAKPFSIITRYLFKLPPSAGATIFLSVIGGYPVGASGVVALYNRRYINLEDSKRLIHLAFCGGPAFAVFVVGEQLLKDINLGIIIYICQALGTIITGILISAKCKVPPKISTAPKEYPMPLSGAFVQACSEASISIVRLCGMVLIFSAMLGMLKDIHILEIIENFLISLNINDGVAQGIIPAFFEVTKGSYALVNGGAPIPIIAAAVGFGGLCVHFQVFSIAEALNVSKSFFIFCRILNAVLTGVFTAIALMFYTPSTNVFSSTSAPISGGISTTAVGGCALLFMSTCFILTTKLGKKTKIISRNKTEYRK